MKKAFIFSLVILILFTTWSFVKAGVVKGDEKLPRYVERPTPPPAPSPKVSSEVKDLLKKYSGNATPTPSPTRKATPSMTPSPKEIKRVDNVFKEKKVFPLKTILIILGVFVTIALIFLVIKYIREHYSRHF